MNLVKNDRTTKIISVVLAFVFGVLFVSLVANAVTTISTSISTGGTLTVGSAGTAVSSMVFGYCTIANVAINASSTGTTICSGATGVASGDRVFVQATGTIPNNFVIQAASTTATDIIQIDLLNIATTTFDSDTDDTGVRSFNFWAVR